MLRYKVCVLFLFLVGICSMSFVSANTNSLPLFGKVIYIDAGHGGLDPGTIYKNIYKIFINFTNHNFIN